MGTPRHRPLAPLRCLGFLLLGAPGARAEPAPQSPSPELVVGEPLEVVVRSSSRKPDAEISGRSVLWMTGDRIQEQGPQSVADALRYQGGVAVQQTTPGQSTIYVRGLSGREVVHLVDGVRVNATIFRSGNNPYLALIDPYALAQLEVVRGPSSVLHGSDALAGVVIGTTRLPGYSLDGPRTRGRAFSSVTSNPAGSALRVDVEHATAWWTAHLGVTHYGSGDIRPGQGERSPVPSSWNNLERPVGGRYRPVLSKFERGTAFSTYAGDGALRFKLGPGLDLALRAQVAYRPELSRYDEITPRFKRDFPASAESSLSPLSRWMTSATLAHRPASRVYDELLFSLSFQRTEEHLRRRPWNESCVDAVEDEPCTTSLRLAPSARLRRESNRSDALGARAEARWKNVTRGLGALVGAEVHRDQVASEASSVRSDRAQITPDPARYPDGSSQTQAGVFGQIEAALGPHVHLHGGLRGALFALTIRERTGDEATPPFSSTLFDGTFSAGARWEFSPGVAWVLNAGRGVRAPNVQDFASLGPRAGGRFQVPNPAIRPEHSLGLDTGLRARIGLLRADLFLFALRYQDAIVLVPTSVNGAASDPDGLGYVTSANASRVDLYGAEGDMEVPLGERGGVYLRWLAMQGTQRNDGATGLPARTPADRTPPLTATTGLWVAPRAGLRLEGFVHGRMRQNRLNDPINLEDNRIPEGGTPGYVTLHVAARATLSPRLSARLALDNLTNTLVLDHGSGFYRAGFSATAALTLKTE
ncbi:MAG: TonB-dependent receptor [Polyangiaceae bacterium]|nr:TonB-dependent receptor [Polyangiaceae bacterium]